jgi:hypothetical protein
VRLTRCDGGTLLQRVGCDEPPPSTRRWFAAFRIRQGDNHALAYVKYKMHFVLPSGDFM